MISSTGVRILIPFANKMDWMISGIYFKSAFLQTSFENFDVYVNTSLDCSEKAKSWLLLTAAHGLANANAK